MSKPAGIGRAVNKRRVNVRRFAGDTAREILSGASFGRDREVFALTGGAFSLIDWVDALLDYTGPAHAVISTWTAASADTVRIETWLKSCRLTSCHWLVDRSFINRQPQLCDDLRERFGDDTIRVYASHAKFVMLSSENGFRIVSMSSANLNHNPRIESFHAADDAALFTEFAEMVNVVFAEQKPGAGFEEDSKRTAPNRALKMRAINDKALSLGVKPASKIPLR